MIILRAPTRRAFSRRPLSLVSLEVGIVLLGAAVAGCGASARGNGQGGPGGPDGMMQQGPVPDLASDNDLSLGATNECGDYDPTCTHSGLGPPGGQFPLGSDPMPDPNVTDTGVDRDKDGYLGLGATHAQFDFIYTANTDDWGRGTVSKINSKTVKEVARFYSVTCYSNPGGGKAQCDGAKGCCSRDDHQRFLNRGMGQPAGVHQAVMLTNNSPSRTAVDFNGDVWVANRAFNGQSSVTKIANEPSECTDRNGTAGIQTSSDINGDGVIDTDCNRNGVPDDIDDVKAKACLNGKPQEFYGVDDECILFTTNTNVNNSIGRPLALGAGAGDFGASDAWAGSYNDAKFFRIDGQNGQIKTSGQLLNAQMKQGNNPYGAAIDSDGVLWAPGVATGQLCYLDTKNPANSGCAHQNGQAFGYGIAMDRDQNVWVGGYPTPNAYRYSPDRSNGFATLGNGFWTTFMNPGAKNGAGGCQGRGIAADSRAMNQYWVWMACHLAAYVVRLDGMVPKPVGADKTVDASAWPAIKVGGNTICGAGVDTQQNVWGIASGGAVATRIVVDAMGNPTAPNLAGVPGTACPVGAGDFCSTAVTGVDAGTTSYTYSDFSGFGLRNFTLPKGSYTVVQSGCKNAKGEPVATKWASVTWDSDVPPNTGLSLKARAGDTSPPDMSWGAWTAPVPNPPAVLDMIMPQPSKYLQVEFDFTTMNKNNTPKLKSFTVAYECPNQPG